MTWLPILGLVVGYPEFRTHQEDINSFLAHANNQANENTGVISVTDPGFGQGGGGPALVRPKNHPKMCNLGLRM